MNAVTNPISVLDGEQQKARCILSILHAHLHPDSGDEAECMDVEWLRQAFALLLSADEYCRERKLELYVIPAMRDMSAGVDALLDRLEGHTVDRVRIIAYLFKQLKHMEEGAAVDVSTLARTMRLYCHEMLERLLIEEQEILPLARQLLPQEKWSRVALQCLSPTQARRHEPGDANYVAMSQRGTGIGRYLH